MRPTLKRNADIIFIARLLQRPPDQGYHQGSGLGHGNFLRFNVRNGRIFGCMRMAAGISFHVKWSHDCIIVIDIAHFPPILTPCTLLTTILLLIDVIKVIDATIFSACLVPRKLRASGAKPQRRRPENFGIELQCDLLQRRKRTRALAYALMRAAERRTPCEQQTDSTRHVRVLFAAGDTPHEVISLLLSTSDAPSEFRSSAQQLRRPCVSFWFLLFLHCRRRRL